MGITPVPMEIPQLTQSHQQPTKRHINQTSHISRARTQLQHLMRHVGMSVAVTSGSDNAQPSLMYTSLIHVLGHTGSRTAHNSCSNVLKRRRRISIRMLAFNVGDGFYPTCLLCQRYSWERRAGRQEESASYDGSAVGQAQYDCCLVDT